MIVAFRNPSLTEWIVAEVVGTEVRLRYHDNESFTQEEGMVIRDISQGRMDDIVQSLPYLINMHGLHIRGVIS